MIGGQDAVKSKNTKYLPVLEGHNGTADPAYQAYLMRAEFYNATGRTVQGMGGAVFRRPPTVKVEQTIEDQLKDVTRNGHTLESFASTLFTENLSVGRVGVLVDMPTKDDADKDPTAARPYWVMYTAEQITHAQWTTTQGRQVLTRVVLKETYDVPSPHDPFATACDVRYRELSLENKVYTVRLYEKHAQTGEWTASSTVVPQRLGQPLPFIPFAFMNASHNDPVFENPPLLDLVDVNLSHYRTAADYEHGAHYTALPTPWAVGVPPQTKLKIGSGTAWILNDSPNSKVGMLEYSGQGLGAIEKIIDRKEKRMAVLGARLLEQQATQPDTATAVRLRQTGDESILKRMANVVGFGLTKCLRIHVWWQGSMELHDTAVNDVDCTLNTDFIETKLVGPELTAIVGAYQAGAISFTTLFHNLQQGEVIPPGRTEEEEKGDIDSEEEARLTLPPDALLAEAQTSKFGAKPVLVREGQKVLPKPAPPKQQVQ
ncbi:MAG TPA: DUF4055 domain-containing protein [Mycobacterium sp.]|nr:DUF4055 domain-containing protein [Mycobacterium sp.]